MQYCIFKNISYNQKVKNAKFKDIYLFSLEYYWENLYVFPISNTSASAFIFLWYICFYSYWIYLSFRCFYRMLSYSWTFFQLLFLKTECDSIFCCIYLLLSKCYNKTIYNTPIVLIEVNGCKIMCPCKYYKPLKYLHNFDFFYAKLFRVSSYMHLVLLGKLI